MNAICIFTQHKGPVVKTTPTLEVTYGKGQNVLPRVHSGGFPFALARAKFVSNGRVKATYKLEGFKG